MGPNATPNGFFGTKVSQPGINVGQANTNQLLFTNNYDTETFYDKSGNARVVIGKLPDSSYGLWVSAPGVNANTAQPNVPGQIIFNSNQTALGIVQTYRGTIPDFLISAGSGTFSISFAHGLSYTPIIDVYVQAFIVNFNTLLPITSTFTRLPIYQVDETSYFLAASSGSYYPLSASYAANSTTIYLQGISDPGGAVNDSVNAFNYVVFAYQQTAA